MLGRPICSLRSSDHVITPSRPKHAKPTGPLIFSYLTSIAPDQLNFLQSTILQSTVLQSFNPQSFNPSIHSPSILQSTVLQSFNPQSFNPQSINNASNTGETRKPRSVQHHLSGATFFQNSQAHPQISRAGPQPSLYPPPCQRVQLHGVCVLSRPNCEPDLKHC